MHKGAGCLKCRAGKVCVCSAFGWVAITFRHLADTDWTGASLWPPCPWAKRCVCACVSWRECVCVCVCDNHCHSTRPHRQRVGAHVCPCGCRKFISNSRCHASKKKRKEKKKNSSQPLDVLSQCVRLCLRNKKKKTKKKWETVHDDVLYRF